MTITHVPLQQPNEARLGPAAPCGTVDRMPANCAFSVSSYHAIFALGLLAFSTGCVATHTDSGDGDRNTTSCPPDIFGGSPSPSLRRIVPDLAVAYVEGSRWMSAACQRK